MSLTNIFKKKTEQGKSQSKPQPKKVKPKIVKEIKIKRETKKGIKKIRSKKTKIIKPVSESKEKKKNKKISAIAYKTLISPYNTEKTVRLQESNQYVFKVFPMANKTQIKRAIEDIFDVKVEKVNIIRIPRKLNKSGKHQGWKKGYKKALIRLKSGQKIDMGVT